MRGFGEKKIRVGQIEKFDEMARILIAFVNVLCGFEAWPVQKFVYFGLLGL